LTHLDADGRARMVDVGGKAETAREAVAEGELRMLPSTLQAIMEGSVPKGDVIACARLAGIMAAKETSRLIPLCHNIALSEVAVDIAPRGDSVLGIEARARTVGRTGVEMEALTAVSVAALTVYDMCKAVDRAMEIGGVRLLAKRGGRSGNWKRAAKR
jgi:cyclic pyranopterin phosphate synthase